jgi:hypothetical protein
MGILIMLSIRSTRNWVLVSSIAVFVGVFEACSVPPDFTYDMCDPKILSTTDPLCQDAGTDGKTSNLKEPDDLGLDPSLLPKPPDPNACKGDCVPEASGPTALDWTWEPLVVWFGSKSEVVAKDCPVGTPYEKSLVFDKLVAPPAKCDACTCLPEGSCTELPSTIEIRSGKCGVPNVETTPFDGPPNWDGSCTSENAMVAGQLCNGVPCAQSISASTLPGPTNESCAPTVEKPNATIDKHDWLDGALACGAKDLVGTCAVTPEHCVETLPDGWLHCLARSGKHDVCPDNYNKDGPRWFYGDNPIDDRGCSACACGTPKDSICIGSLRLYSDMTCAMELNNNILSSIEPFCADLTIPGLALGSKTIGNLSYLPGTCSVTGGEPIGTVIPNEEAIAGAVTFCCRDRDPEPLPLPPIR